MPNRGAFGVETLRDAVKARVSDTSIRAVAEEIGMSPSGLHVLLKGSDPHPATREKLVAWYIEQQRSKARSAVSKADVDAAVQLLIRYVRDDGRPGAQARRAAAIMRRLNVAFTDAK